jgi:hypothetical protein
MATIRSRAPMRVSVLVLALALSGVARGAAPRDPSVLSLGERQRVALVVLNPKRDLANTSQSQLIELSEAALRLHTSLTADPYPQEAVADCQGRIWCIVERVRKEREARYVVILSNLAQEGRADRLAALLIDADRALEEHRALAGGRDSEEELEARISEVAVRARPAAAMIATPAEAARHLEQLFTKDFRGAFEESGHWEPYGAIEIAGLPKGTQVIIDGASAGLSESAKTRVEEIIAGRRTLRLEHPETEPYEAPIEIKARETLAIAPELVARAGPSGSALNTIAIAAGVGLAAGGAILTVVSLASSPSYEAVCLRVNTAGGSGEGTCGSSEFVRFGAPDRIDDHFATSPNGGGPAIAPLGYSLLAAGAVMSLGTIFFGAEDRAPILPIALGLAAGGISYGASVALEGDLGFSR